jgi:hypothetical protein
MLSRDPKTLCLAAFLATIGLATPLAVAAQNLDPFQKDEAAWRSFNRYLEDEKSDRLPIYKNLEEEKPPIITAPVLEQKVIAQQATEKARSQTSLPTVAAPDRPIDLPVMPGVKPDFAVSISSTEDDAPPAAKIVNMADDPDVQLPKQNWQDAHDAANQHAQGNYGKDLHEDLNVRMTMLPGVRVFKKTVEEKKVVAKKKRAPSQSPSEVAACAAIDAYKKKQLDALQSDRETLAALHDAITQLGLEKQLGFMTSSDSKLNAAADTKPVLMDVPSLAMTPSPPQMHTN